MTSRFPRFSVIARLAIIGVMLAVVTLATNAFAARHIGLSGSSPAKDSHVMTTLREIRLAFTGPVDVTKASVELVGADNKAVSLDTLRAVADSPRVAVAKLIGAVPSGTYTVKWKAVAADGANGSGSFDFMYMAPAK